MNQPEFMPVSFCMFVLLQCKSQRFKASAHNTIAAMFITHQRKDMAGFRELEDMDTHMRLSAQRHISP